MHFPVPRSTVETEQGFEMADLLAYFQHQLALQDTTRKICEPEVEGTQTHISGNDAVHCEAHLS